MEEKDYNALVDMFASDGWKYFTKQAMELEDALTRGAVDSAVSNEQWQYLRGQLGQLRSILGYEAFVVAAWEQAEQDKKLELFEGDPDDVVATV
jgi:cell division septation protein DedD